jgi:hypothetical protein
MKGTLGLAHVNADADKNIRGPRADAASTCSLVFSVHFDGYYAALADMRDLLELLLFICVRALLPPSPSFPQPFTQTSPLSYIPKLLISSQLAVF